jgi:hypothetical protein
MNRTHRYLSRPLPRRRTAGVLRAGRRLRRDDGFTAVMVGLLLTVILIFAAFAIDGGMGYQGHRQSQNASDAGAMAGVRALEQLKFLPHCSTGSQPCTWFNSPAALRTEIVRQSRASGADAASPAVACYLLDANAQRMGHEFCASGVDPWWWEVMTPAAPASGVEVHATVTRDAVFAGVMGVDDLPASTLAKAFIYNFTGGTSAPFIVCGIRPSLPYPAEYDPAKPLAWSYDLLVPNGSGGYDLQPGVVGQHYQLQGSTNATCGAPSAKFKGIGGDDTLQTLPVWTPIVNGNAFLDTVQIAVAGIQMCDPDAATYDGCGMLLPIAEKGRDGATGVEMYVVTWLAWQVWGGGNSYTFTGAANGATGESCRTAWTPANNTNGMKFCGKLLGAVSTTGGAGSGPGTAGQPHVLKLTE